MLSLIWQMVPVHSPEVGDPWSSWLLLPSSHLTCPPPKLLQVVSVYQSHFWEIINNSHVPRSSSHFSIRTLPWPLSGIWAGWILLKTLLLPLVSLIAPYSLFLSYLSSLFRSVSFAGSFSLVRPLNVSWARSQTHWFFLTIHSSLRESHLFLWLYVQSGYRRLPNLCLHLWNLSAVNSYLAFTWHLPVGV